MTGLTKREKDTLREISHWNEYPWNWKQKTRAKLEVKGLVENTAPANCYANYRPTEAGKKLLKELIDAGEWRP